MLLGDSGTAKSHLSIALGTAAALVNELAEAADERQLSRLVARYGRLDPHCLDELNYVRLDPRGAKLLFQILTEREERASVAVASNAPFSEWGQTFEDPRLAATVVNRLTFHAQIIEAGSGSHRARTEVNHSPDHDRQVGPIAMCKPGPNQIIIPMKALQVEVESLLEWTDAVEGQTAQRWGSRTDDVNARDVEEVDTGDNSKHELPGAPPRRIFPELITEHPEPVEEQVYGAAAEEVVEWREAWAERRAARLTLDWLRAERRQLELELRLIGVFGLTPPWPTRHGANGVETASWNGGAVRPDGCAGRFR